MIHTRQRWISYSTTAGDAGKRDMVGVKLIPVTLRSSSGPQKLFNERQCAFIPQEFIQAEKRPRYVGRLLVSSKIYRVDSSWVEDYLCPSILYFLQLFRRRFRILREMFLRIHRDLTESY